MKNKGFFSALFAIVQSFIFKRFILKISDEKASFLIKKIFFFFAMPTFTFLVLFVISDNHIPKYLVLIVIAGFLFVSICLAFIFYNDFLNIKNYVASYVNDPGSADLSLSIFNDCELIRNGIDLVVQKLDEKDDVLRAAIVENDAVFNLLCDPVMIVDRQLNVLRLNKGAKILFGDSFMNLKKCNIFNGTIFIETLQKKIINMKLGGIGEYSGFEVEVAVDGIKKFFKVSIALFGTSNNVSSNFVVIMNNVTSYKDFEQSMTDFVANASHEIRTPLTAIIGFVETIRDMVKDDPASVDRFMGIVIDQGHKVVDLLNSLLTLSKADFERNVIIDSYIDIIDIVNDSCLQCLHLANEKKVGIVKNLSKDLPYVKANYIGMLRVCNNLLSNAIKHSNVKGTVEINVDVCYDVPFSDVPNNEKFLFINIKDFGCGMESIHISRITERFYKISPASNGSGLGLSIVASILERHDAKMKIESEKDAGSSFTVYLRLTENDCNISNMDEFENMSEEKPNKRFTSENNLLSSIYNN